MRLGDLDALAQKIEDKIKTYPLDSENAIGKISFEYCKMLIDNAPTVEYPFYQEAYQTGYEEGKNKRPQGEFTRKELESWLYRIAGNNLDNELGRSCEEIIRRLDGFERFVSDMRKGGAE